MIKKILKLDFYKDALLSNKTIRTTQQRFKNDYHIIKTEEINKIALSRKDDKRIQSFDGIHTYHYGIDKICLKSYNQRLEMNLFKCIIKSLNK